jgi:hypothetical protein
MYIQGTPTAFSPVSRAMTPSAKLNQNRPAGLGQISRRRSAFLTPDARAGQKLSFEGNAKREREMLAADRNLIIFDWDDTLCPTHWIRQHLLCALEDQMEFMVAGKGEEEATLTEYWQELPSWFRHPLPHEPIYEEPIQELLSAVEQVLRTARRLGRVVILTNGISGWVSKSAKQWLSPLRALFHDLKIDVKYARDFPVTQHPTLSQFYGKNREEKMQSHREWQFTEMKAKAMAHLIKGASHRKYKNLISIGDSQFEINAMEAVSRRYHRTTSSKRSFSAGDANSISVEPIGNLLQFAHRHGYGCVSPERCYHKTVKMRPFPAINQMIAQLRTIKECLPRLVDTAADLTCSTEEEPFDMGKLGAALPKRRRAKSKKIAEKTKK